MYYYINLKNLEISFLILQNLNKEQKEILCVKHQELIQNNTKLVTFPLILPKTNPNIAFLIYLVLNLSTYL